MSTLRAALVAACFSFGASAPVFATATLTLDEAFRRVLTHHPELRALTQVE